MKNHKHILSFMLIMIMISVSACGGAGGGTPKTADPGTPDSATATETEEVSEESTDTLVTEDDYRNAIASAADDEKRLELYKQFSSSYRMNADEYIAYAGLCEAAGDTVSQRNALWRLYMIDPTEENGQRMSDVVVNITDAEDANAADMIKNVVEEVKKCEADDFSSDGLRTIFTSEEWKNSFWLDNGTFTSHTKYLGDKVSATVDADSIETRVTVTADDDRYFARMSYDGLSAGHVSKGDASGDKYYLRQKDAGGVDTVIVNGYT
ncbi:MAG: hypothetical protein K6F87_07530, partial [Lachnospiraceae bacterium]|nr:hypothetical protein [Lachnospiraceae bacterium]